MRGIGDHGARDTARPCRMQSGGLPAERDAPGDRAAPVVPDDREFPDVERIGEREAA